MRHDALLSPMRARLLLASLLLLAPTAAAAFVETPLRVSADPAEAEVGDVVTLTLEPANETEAARLADADLVVSWSGIEDESTHAAAPVTLDAEGRATYAWTVPQEADDLNVFVVFSQGDEQLGQAHVRIGDAEPMMFTMGGGAGAVEEETVEATPPVQATATGTTSTPAPTPAATKATPGPALAAIVGALVVALVVARRR